MGWLYDSHLSERRDRHRLIARLTEGNESRECLAHCTKGDVLWSVWEIRNPDGKTVRYIGCDLMEYGGRECGWGYKPMEESMGPTHYTCLLNYFEMVPEPDNQYARSWRLEVLRQHADRRRRLDALRDAFHTAKNEGGQCVLKLEGAIVPQVAIKSLVPLRGEHGGRIYCIPLRMIGECSVVPDCQSAAE